MKRGRPAARNKMKTLILDVLGKSEVPITTASIQHILSKEPEQKFSWNTIQKYLDELVKTNRISAIDLPHSKSENKPGLTVYTLKKE